MGEISLLTLSDGDTDLLEGFFMGVEEGSLASADAVMPETVEEDMEPPGPTVTPGWRVRREAREKTPCIGAH